MKPAIPSIRTVICEGSRQASKILSGLFTIWKKHGEKIGLGEDLSDNGCSNIVDDSIQSLFCKMYKHLSWYTGHTA